MAITTGNAWVKSNATKVTQYTAKGYKNLETISNPSTKISAGDKVVVISLLGSSKGVEFVKVEKGKYVAIISTSVLTQVSPSAYKITVKNKQVTRYETYRKSTARGKMSIAHFGSTLTVNDTVNADGIKFIRTTASNYWFDEAEVTGTKSNSSSDSKSETVTLSLIITAQCYGYKTPNIVAPNSAAGSPSGTPGSNIEFNPVVKTYKKDEKVYATQKKTVRSVVWYYIQADSCWIIGKYAKLNKSTSKNAKDKDKKKKNTAKIKKESRKLQKEMTKMLNSLANTRDEYKYTNRIFGAPHQFLPTVDKRLKVSKGVNTFLGYNYVENILCEAPIVHIVPGNANYLPNMKRADRDSLSGLFTDALLNESKDNKSMLTAVLDSLGKDGVRYYEFAPAYTSYYTYVNLLCMIASYYTGVQDIKFLGTAYKEWDWHHYKYNKPDEKKKKKKTKEDEFFPIKLVKSAINKIGDLVENFASDAKDAIFNQYRYVSFYVNANYSFSESASNSTRESSLESKFEGAENFAKEMHFLSGTTGEAMDLFGDILNKIGGTSDWVSRLLGNGENAITKVMESANYALDGYNVAFPEIWSNSDYGKSFDLSIDLVSPYGTREAIFLNCFVPLMHLLALTLPRYVSPNSFGPPFIIKAIACGFFACEMGIVESINVEKGVDGNWSADGLPTKITCTLRIKELYSTLSMNRLGDWKGVFKNTALLNFIAVTCGVDITSPTVILKVQTMLSVFVSSVKYNFTKRYYDKLMESFNNLGSLYYNI